MLVCCEITSQSHNLLLFWPCSSVGRATVINSEGRGFGDKFLYPGCVAIVWIFCCTKIYYYTQYISFRDTLLLGPLQLKFVSLQMHNMSSQVWQTHSPKPYIWKFFPLKLKERRARVIEKCIIQLHGPKRCNHLKWIQINDIFRIFASGFVIILC